MTDSVSTGAGTEGAAQQGRAAQVPALRFPEYEGEWEEKRTGDFLVLFRKRVSASTKIPVYTSSRTGLRPQRDHFDGQEITNEGEYGVVPIGYFTYRHMSDDLTFKFNLNLVHDEIAVSKEYPVFTTKNLSSEFLHLKLNFSVSFQKFAAMQKLGGTRTRLYFKTLEDWRTLFPSLAEQKKIAAFLGVVDAKIAALRDRAAGLTRYKRGLMQALFSQRLRFTNKDGTPFPDWEEKRLGEVLTIGSGRDYKHLSDGDIPVYGTGGYMTSVDEYLYDGESVCIGRKGTIDNPTLLTGKFWTVDTLFYTHNFKGVIPQFIFGIFQQINWKKHNEASGVPSLSKGTIEKLKVQLPHPDEQAKIAEALSAMDAKIAAVTAQLDNMQDFKKALLQQMFV